MKRYFPMALLFVLGCGDGSAIEGESEAEAEAEAESEAESEAEAESEGEDCEKKSGVVCVYAGTGELGFNGDGLDRLETWLYWPLDLEFGPDGTPWVLDWNNHKVRRINADQTFETMVGNFVGDGDDKQGDLTQPGVPGTEVELNHPTDIQFGPDGLLYFAAWHNLKIRVLDPASGLVYVMFGRGAGYAGDGNPIDAATRVNLPKSIVFDAAGNLYLSDQRNFRIRRVDVDDQVITTVVGIGTAGYSGDDGDPLAAQINFQAGANPEPSGALAFDADGRLYVADSLNHCIRLVDFEANTIETIVGTGTAGYSGDGGPATDAELNNPRDIEIGPDGNLYLSDTENNVIRMVDLTANTIDTVVGSGKSGKGSVGGPPLEVELFRPFGIAFDGDGVLYIADTFNSRILKVTP